MECTRTNRVNFMKELSSECHINRWCCVMRLPPSIFCAVIYASYFAWPAVLLALGDAGLYFFAGEWLVGRWCASGCRGNCRGTGLGCKYLLNCG